MDKMAESFWPFVDDRINMVTAALEGTPAGRELRERKAEADGERRKLVECLGGGKGAVLILDDFEMALLGVKAIYFDFIYAQGMQDGFRLSRIFDGNVIPWLADAYVPASEKGDGKDA